MHLRHSIWKWILTKRLIVINVSSDTWHKSPLHYCHFQQMTFKSCNLSMCLRKYCPLKQRKSRSNIYFYNLHLLFLGNHNAWRLVLWKMDWVLSSNAIFVYHRFWFCTSIWNKGCPKWKQFSRPVVLFWNIYHQIW